MKYFAPKGAVNRAKEKSRPPPNRLCNNPDELDNVFFY